MGVGDREIDGRGYDLDSSSAARVRFSAMGEAWGLVRQQWGVWILTVLIVLAANSAVSGVLASSFHLHRHGFDPFRWRVPRQAAALAFVLTAVINGFFVGGMFRMACRQVRGLRIGVDDLFGVVDVLGELVLGSVLHASAVMVAGLFCFIPGLIVNGLLMFTLPLIVDSQMPAPAALGASFHALKRQWLGAAIFHVTVIILSGAGYLLCCVGLLFTAPLYALSIAVLYRDFFLGRGPAAFKPVPPARGF